MTVFKIVSGVVFSLLAGCAPNRVTVHTTIYPSSPAPISASVEASWR